MIRYIWFKLCKKLMGKGIKHSKIPSNSQVEAGSIVVDSSFGEYSYCGYDCTIINTKIGKFCSIADGVKIGSARHPMNWLSTSPAFYKGRDSIPKDLAVLNFDSSPIPTDIGNDVWIGLNAIIKGGIQIGDGAIIGMGSVVTKDVEPYSVVAGNPAKLIRKRFDDETIQILLKKQWWNSGMDEIRHIAADANDVNKLTNDWEV